MKLAGYAMVTWLAYAMAGGGERAARMLDALIVIFTAYAVYALALAWLGISQFQLFYSERAPSPEIAGPFVSRNNFATYAGLGMLCAWVRLFALGGGYVVSSAGPRAFLVSALQFLLGRGWLPLFGGVITFSLLLSTASRGGFLAALTGIAAILALSGTLAVTQARSRQTVFGVIALGFAVILLFLLSGGDLQTRLFATLEEPQLDAVRLVLWDSAARMIADAPLTGLGLGTFETAYPLYADRLLPFTLDKAHNDFLELAAGWGLPAALLWWLALSWLLVLCIRGVFVRRRDRAYPLLAAGCGALVATHSLFDFSLQIPAIALTFAVILGLGVAQAFPTRSQFT
jgi:O-antigen ligase